MIELMSGDDHGGFGLMNTGDDISIPIPLLVPVFEGSRLSDSWSSQGADSRTHSFSKSRALNGTTMIRRRNTEPDSIKSRQTIIKPTHYPVASRVKESQRKIPPETESNTIDDLDDARSSLHEKIKAMRSGILISERDNEDDDSKSSDEKDDADEDKKETNYYEEDKKAAEKPRKFSKLKFFDPFLFMEFLINCCAFGVLIYILRNPGLKAHVIWGSEIWRWYGLILVIVFGRWTTKLANALVILLIETKFMFNEKVVYYVHGVKKSVRFAVWVALVLLTWLLLVDKPHDHSKRSEKASKVFGYIRKTLLSALIGALLWMAKTFLVKFIAARFHVKSFFAKIKEAISDEYILWTLSVPRSINEVKQNGQANAKEESGWMGFRKKRDKIQQEERFTLKKLGRMKAGKMPASTMGQLIHRIRSSKLSFVSNPNLKGQKINASEQKNITNGSEAETAASLIFKNVATNRVHPGYITMEDLMHFENKHNKDCINEWFFKLAEEEKISEAALSEWVVNMYEARKYLSHSLRDSKTAIEELDRIFSGVLTLLIIIVWVLVMGIATTKVLLLFSSQILLLGFMFGNTCKTLFDCLIFVFVMHPFDVGDRCVVDGVQMIVEEMDILKTAFLRYDNQMIYYPNDVLKTKPVGNFNRSPEKMGESVLFHVDFSTTLASIEALKDKIKWYVEEEKPQYWHPNPSLQIKEINEDISRMKIALYVDHRMNFQDFGEKSKRRSELMLALKQMLDDLGIKYHPHQVHFNQTGSTVQPPASSAYRRAI